MGPRNYKTQQIGSLVEDHPLIPRLAISRVLREKRQRSHGVTTSAAIRALGNQCGSMNAVDAIPPLGTICHA